MVHPKIEAHVQKKLINHYIKMRYKTVTKEKLKPAVGGPLVALPLSNK